MKSKLFRFARFSGWAFAGLTFLTLSLPASAQIKLNSITTYSTREDFYAAASTESFLDEYPSGTAFVSGSALGGVAISTNSPKSLLILSGGVAVPGHPNALVTASNQPFFPGDIITFTFTHPIRAFGISFGAFGTTDGIWSATTDSGEIALSHFDPLASGENFGSFIGFTARAGILSVTIKETSGNNFAFGLTDLELSAATGTLLNLYDDFSEGSIDPSKWSVSPMCGGNAYDCAREVRNGHLRLAVRGYGDVSRDSGSSFASSQVLFTNPNSIDSLQVNLSVQSFSASACSANSDAAHPQFLISGTFFNTGTGTASGDVSAYLMVERRTDDLSDPPGILRVGGFMSLDGRFFNNVDLGTLQVGEQARVSIQWDLLNKAFVLRIVKSTTTPAIVEQSMPYTLPDSQMPAVPIKSIQAGSFAPNCVSQRSIASIDVNVDNVRANLVGPQ